MGHLRVTKLGKAYRRYARQSGRLLEWLGLGAQHELKWILRDINFEIQRGEAVGLIGVNGAAARLTAIGNRVIIMSFCHLTLDELKVHRPKVVICTPDNRIAEQLSYDPE